MTDDRRYRIRRAVLRALADTPRPLIFDEICDDGNCTALHISRDELCAELPGLSVHKYVDSLRPGRDGLYSITAAGYDQIRKESDLDEYIWGSEASKFQM